MPFERFVEDVLVGGLGVRALLFGYNTNFGKGGLGTFSTVAPLAKRFHFAIHEAPPIRVLGEPISATRIRRAIEEGDLAQCERASRAPTRARRDRRARATGAGARSASRPRTWTSRASCSRPRASTRSSPRSGAGATPPSRTSGRGRRFRRASPARPLLEVHVPGLDFEFYGESIEVELVRKIRDEIRFPSREALIDRIRKDVASLGGPPLLP